MSGPLERSPAMVASSLRPRSDPPAAFEAALARAVAAYEMQHPRYLHAVGVSPSQLTALFLLRHDHESTPASMAARLQHTSSSITYLLDQLESRELIVRRPHPRDRRSLVISITDAGEAIIDQFVATISDGIQAATVEDPDAAEAATPLLERFAEHFSEELN